MKVGFLCFDEQLEISFICCDESDLHDAFCSIAMSTSRQRSVLITGCSQNGLGYALAVAFHHAGLRVFATARDPARMAGLEDLGIECLRLDVCNEESIRACVAQVSLLTKRSGEGEGILDCLFNNAGGGTSPCSFTGLCSRKASGCQPYSQQMRWHAVGHY
jgi:NAD(P)-dependent dehydrogenase (short-subunit alcohol dehydrogenase family)